MDEWGFGTRLPRCFQHIQCAHGVRVKIIKRNGGGTVMAWLRGGVNNYGGTDFIYQRENSRPVTDIEFMMNKSGEALLQALLVPSRVPLRAKKDRTLVAIHAMNLAAQFTRK